MRLVEQNGRRYATFENPIWQRGLVHAFATRPLDVGMRADGRSSQRLANRQAMARDLGLDPSRLHCCVQVHRPRLVRVAQPEGRDYPDTDGLLTDISGVGLMVFSADCPLLLLYDPLRRALGVAHASWRCTMADIAGRLVAQMAAAFGCRPADLHAGIGPSAGPQNYEVGSDVYAAAAGLPDREACFRRVGGKLYFDLWQANRQQLEAAGLEPPNIETAGLCTMERSDLFYSFRREGAGCGHFGLLAALA